MYKYFLLFSFIVLFSNCDSEDEKTVQEVEVPKEIGIKKKEPSKITLIVNMDHLRMRDAAGQEAKVIGNLSAGEKLIYKGEKSDFTTPVKLRGYPYDEPWIKVSTKEKTEGWVYAGGISFEEGVENKLAKALIDNRIQKLFGQKSATELRKFQVDFRKANTDVELAETYRNALKLQAVINQELHDEVEVNDPEKAADMEWLRQSLPGFIIQFAAEGTLFHSFLYYEDWAKMAQRTSGKVDDKFFAMMYAVYPIDHIEHFFPAWFLQTWDYGGHSELGKGVHKDLLEKMNKNLAESDLFAPEIESLKNKLLEDITNPEITYWNEKKAVLDEISTILEANLGILSEEDKIALETRKKHFEHPDENGIKLNYRSGQHD